MANRDQQLVPVVGMDVKDLLARLKADGFVIENTQMPVGALAEKHATDTEETLAVIFR